MSGVDGGAGEGGAAELDEAVESTRFLAGEKKGVLDGEEGAFGEVLEEVVRVEEAGEKAVGVGREVDEAELVRWERRLEAYGRKRGKAYEDFGHCCNRGPPNAGRSGS